MMGGVFRAVVCAALLALAACASQSRRATVEAMSYDDLAARYNERVAHLNVLRGRGVVNFRWTDAKGAEQWEQGNLDVQVIQPGRLVFRVHKLGETYAWAGCDEERYWLFDLLRDDERVAYVGAHDELTREKAERVGLIAPPGDLVRLLGIEPLPEIEAGAASPTVEITPSGWRVRRPAARGGQWVYEIDGTRVQPSRIALVDDAGAVVIEALLRDYRPATLADKAVIAPIAMEVDIAYPAANASMRIDLQSVNDRRPRDAAFEVERIAGQLEPDRMVDLDAQDVAGATQ